MADKGRVNGSTGVIGTCDQPYTVFFLIIFFLRENRDVFVRARHAIRIAGVCIFARFLFELSDVFLFFFVLLCVRMWLVIVINENSAAGFAEAEI